MSGSLNKVMLIGNTGDEVKMHYFDNGGCVGRFPLATNETFTNRNGERITNTEWHNIVVRDKAAEVCEKYLKKGDKIYIEGKIKTRKWVDEKGIERYSTEIQCREFTFLSVKESTPQSAVGGDMSQSQEKFKQEPIEKLNDEGEEDLPF